MTAVMASVIGLVLAEGVFSYPRLNRFRPRFTDLMVSLLYGGNQFYLVLYVLSTPHQGVRTWFSMLLTSPKWASSYHL